MTITGQIRDPDTAAAVQRLVNEIQDAESESRARERQFREAAALVDLFDPEGRPDVALAAAREFLKKSTRFCCGGKGVSEEIHTVLSLILRAVPGPIQTKKNPRRSDGGVCSIPGFHLHPFGFGLGILMPRAMRTLASVFTFRGLPGPRFTSSVVMTRIV